MKMTYFERKEVINTIKVGSMIWIEIVDNIKIADVTPKNVCSTFSQSRSGMKSTQGQFKLIKFSNCGKKTSQTANKI